MEPVSPSSPIYANEFGNEVVARLAAIDGSIPSIYQDRPLSRSLCSLSSSQRLPHSVFCACCPSDLRVQSARNTCHHSRVVSSQIHPMLDWVVGLIDSHRERRLHPPLHQSRPARHLLLLRHLSRLHHQHHLPQHPRRLHVLSPPVPSHQQHRGVGRRQPSVVRHRPHLHSQRTSSLSLLSSPPISEEPWSSSTTSSSSLTFIM